MHKLEDFEYYVVISNGQFENLSLIASCKSCRAHYEFMFPGFDIKVLTEHVCTRRVVSKADGNPF